MRCVHHCELCSVQLHAITSASHISWPRTLYCAGMGISDRWPHTAVERDLHACFYLCPVDQWLWVGWTLVGDLARGPSRGLVSKCTGPGPGLCDRSGT